MSYNSLRRTSVDSESPPPLPPYATAAAGRPTMAAEVAYSRTPSASSSPSPSLQASRTTPTQYTLPAHPAGWSLVDGPELDDQLHDPNPKYDLGSHGIWTLRGLANIGTIILIVCSLVMLFAGWPILAELQKPPTQTLGAFNLGGINATGQIALTTRGPIDPDTPASAYYHTSLDDGTTQWELVFSDEFEQDGRTFWPGDDPYWEAEDIWYHGTQDLEWSNPVNAYTQAGNLVIELHQRPDHGLNFSGAFMSTWNKFCFTGGYIEVSVILPGTPLISGLWPAVWTLGNLGRIGYTATTDGMWPYSYDACDVGTLANQTLPGTIDTSNMGINGGRLSDLPGQRLSRCSCPGSGSHPGPMHADGSYAGRSAPEIDIIEAQVSNQQGEVSQSGQFAPFDPEYQWTQELGETFTIADPQLTKLNTYFGSPTQQALSGVTTLPSDGYELAPGGGSHKLYGFEYAPGYEADDAYITWISDAKQSWSVRAAAVGANATSMISARAIPDEPMYIVANMAYSHGFAYIEQEKLDPLFPFHMRIDYVRVYQDPAKRNVGCNPENRPTSDYIANHLEAYTNPNYTSWSDLYDDKPKNRLVDTC